MTTVPCGCTALSLDCAICRKKHRTVVVSPIERFSYCTPTQHTFPARVINCTTTILDGVTEAMYLVEYYYIPFEDTREKSRRDPASQAMPRWGRVHFELTCPTCGNTSKHGAQSNTGRPWTAYCACGHALYTETREIPLFAQIDVLPVR